MVWIVIVADKCVATILSSHPLSPLTHSLACVSMLSMCRAHVSLFV